MLRKSSITLSVLLFSALSYNVAADQYHFRNTLVGDRAAGLGGAYVAVSDDPSGMYYNPAGIAYTSGNNLSGSMNAFNLTQKTYKNVFGQGRDWVRTSSGLVPNFFGVTQKFGPGILGFSYTVPDSTLENQDQIFYNVGTPADLEYWVNFNNQDYTYNLGPSYAIAFGKKLSVGVTLYAYYKTQELILNQMIRSMQNTVAMQWFNSYSQYTIAGIRPIYGVMYTPMEKLSIGLTYSHTNIFYQNTQEQSASTQCFDENTHAACTAPAAFDIDLQKESGFNTETTLPSELNIGAAYFANPALLISTSMSYHSPLIGNYAVINAALGAELFFTPTIAMRVGLHTDRSATPPLVAGALTTYNEHVDLYGGGISFSNFSRSSSLTVGANAVFGTGQSQIIGDPDRVQSMQVIGLSVYMSALYSY